MDDKAFSIREAIIVGWKKTIANLWSFFIILAIIWFVSALVSGFSKASGTHYFLASIISILGWILVMLIQMGFLRVVLKMLDGDKIGINDFSTSLPQFLRFLGAGILCAIAVVAGFFIFIIPGVILALRLQFCSYLVLEKDLGPVEALKGSWNMTRGQTWKLFLLSLVLIGIVILGALLIGVGLLVAVPLVTVASAFVYRKLLHALPSASPAAVA